MIRTVDVSDTIHTGLVSCSASGGFRRAVAIIDTFNTLVLSERTGRSSSSTGTVSISFTYTSSGDGDRSVSRKDTDGIARTLSVLRLGASPLGNRAVIIISTLYTATSLNVTDRCTSILTLVIRGTEVHTSLGDGIAVRVDVIGVRRAVKVLTGHASSKGCAVLAASIFITVCISAVTVGLTIHTSSSGDVTPGLVGFETSIIHAVSVGQAGLASGVCHTVVTLSCSPAAIVIRRCRSSTASEGVNTLTVRAADSVRSHGWGTIIRSTVGVCCAGPATSVLHAIGL